MSLLDAFLEGDPAESEATATGPKVIWFAIRSDGQRGSGTAGDPYNGSELVEANGLLRFDNILNSDEVPANATIRLGPGVFKTGGGDGANRLFPPPWLPKSGQRIIGSGMFATTLKLSLTAEDTTRDAKFYAIGLPYASVTSYEVSDLTIDCDLDGQPNSVQGGTTYQYARIAVGAIALAGRNIRIHRVRVINWGSKTRTQECFPIAVGGGGTVPPRYPAEELSNVVEDCILEQPAWNTGWQVTGLAAQVLRNNFVRGDRVRPPDDPKPTLRTKRLAGRAGLALDAQAAGLDQLAGQRGEARQLGRPAQSLQQPAKRRSVPAGVQLRHRPARLGTDDRRPTGVFG